MQAWDKFFEINHAQSEEVQELLRKLLQDLQSINEELVEYINTPSCNLPTSSYDDEDDEESSIPLKDIIISGLLPVENLVQVPSESKGIPDKICDVPFRDNSPPLDISKDQFEGFSDSNDDSTSIDDDSFSIDDIDYVEASPPDSELVSLEEVEDFHTEDGEIEDDILREKLLKTNLLIAMIGALKDNPTPSSNFVTKSSSTSPNLFLEETNTFDNFLTKYETFCFDLEENSSGSTTTHSDYSLPDYEAFYFDDDHIAEKSSGTGTDNRPPMLEESDFESWKIRIERYIHDKPLGKLIWKSIKNGPSPHPMITVTSGEGEQQTQVTREKTDEEFTEAHNNKERSDIKATNILSQGLPRHIFNTLNQTETIKEIWENVELLMQGSGLTEQQKKETLFDHYERFQANGNESIHDYFVRFHKLIRK
ncbi:hypothetical protein Tco_0030697 [Tanacetum coccineum]